MSEAHKRVVETGYNRMAEHYLSTKDPEDELTLGAPAELARRNIPGTSFLKADMTYLNFAPKER